MQVILENTMNNQFWLFKFNIKQSLRNGRSWAFLRPTCYGPTDGRTYDLTDGLTDTASYRVVSTRLKTMRVFSAVCPIILFSYDYYADRTIENVSYSYWVLKTISLFLQKYKFDSCIYR